MGDEHRVVEERFDPGAGGAGDTGRPFAGAVDHELVDRGGDAALHPGLQAGEEVLGLV
ncbi:hypothetical protein Ae331Ps2_6343c [Pseudonocardia sp. Ae331_Ps2]|nr:hypothetical protein Ae331Ps2_6343c [Pseudonocardia sp. Ae331_Ps2]